MFNGFLAFNCLLMTSSGPQSKQGQMDLQGLSTFAKYGGEVVLGFAPRKLLDLAAKAGIEADQDQRDLLPLRTIAPPELSKDLQQLIEDAYVLLCTHLEKTNRQYRSKEARLEKDRLIHGALTEQKQSEFDQLKKLFERLLAIVTVLSDCTGKDMPLLEVRFSVI